MGKKNSESKPVVICTVWDEISANIIKSHLESEGIPAVLKWESAAIAFGLTGGGLGQVSVLVPPEFAEDAKRVIESRDDQAEPEDLSPPDAPPA